jgi:hypothetical protein
VTFAGFVDDVTKHRLLAAAWVHALPSVKEGWSLAVVESAAHGTPTVAFRSAGGPTESVLDGETGAARRRPDRLRPRTARLLTEPALRESMGRAARAHAARFSWPATAAAVEAELRALTGLPARPGGGPGAAGPASIEVAGCPPLLLVVVISGLFTGGALLSEADETSTSEAPSASRPPTTAATTVEMRIAPRSGCTGPPLVADHLRHAPVRSSGVRERSSPGPSPDDHRAQAENGTAEADHGHPGPVRRRRPGRAGQLDQQQVPAAEQHRQPGQRPLGRGRAGLASGAPPRTGPRPPAAGPAAARRRPARR